jgi:hypothetical protein
MGFRCQPGTYQRTLLRQYTPHWYVLLAILSYVDSFCLLKCPVHCCRRRLHWSFYGEATPLRLMSVPTRVFYSQDITPSVHLSEQALQHEKQRAGDALNLARSQESFLDVVSVSRWSSAYCIRVQADYSPFGTFCSTN